MSNSSELIHQYGLLFVFGNVLVEQLGLPIPAIPVLLLAGTAAAKGEISLRSAFVLAIVASIIADSLWYEIGRKKGGVVLSVACRISLNPDSCVRQTESFLAQWGFPSLFVAKFIPGFSMVAPPTVGSMKKPRYLFWLFDTIGSGLWAGTCLITGFIFFNSIERILSELTRLGLFAVVLIILVFVSFVLVKYFQRQRFYQSLQIPRISVEDLKKLIDEGHNPLVLDVRSQVAQAIDMDRIPGALGVLLESLHNNHVDLPRDREIITYCTCPNEASAALAAQTLMNQSFQRVYPLKGGLDAWRKAGYAVERTETIPIPPGEIPIVVVPISGENTKSALPPCD
jgi:membrane protein DedA with SNARE-associated domain/rhodanese-related sulfurtransferase